MCACPSLVDEEDVGIVCKGRDLVVLHRPSHIVSRGEIFESLSRLLRMLCAQGSVERHGVASDV